MTYETKVMVAEDTDTLLIKAQQAIEKLAKALAAQEDEQQLEAN